MRFLSHSSASTRAIIISGWKLVVIPQLDIDKSKFLMASSCCHHHCCHCFHPNLHIHLYSLT
jgi:hypothetical protein